MLFLFWKNRMIFNILLVANIFVLGALAVKVAEEDGIPVVTGMNRKCHEDICHKTDSKINIIIPQEETNKPAEHKLDTPATDSSKPVTDGTETCDAEGLGTNKKKSKQQEDGKEQVRELPKNSKQVKKKCDKKKRANKKPKEDTNSDGTKETVKKRKKKPSVYGAHNIDEWYSPPEENEVYFGPHEDPKMYPPKKVVSAQYLKEEPEDDVPKKKLTRFQKLREIFDNYKPASPNDGEETSEQKVNKTIARAKLPVD